MEPTRQERISDCPQRHLRDHARFRESALTAGEIMRRLRASRSQAQEVVSLVEKQVPDGADAWTEAEVRRFMAKVGADLLDDVLDLAHAERMARRDDGRCLERVPGVSMTGSLRNGSGRPPLRIQDLAIDGRDVMRILRLEPGPLVGEVLRDLHQRNFGKPGPERAQNSYGFS